MTLRVFDKFGYRVVLELCWRIGIFGCSHAFVNGEFTAYFYLMLETTLNIWFWPGSLLAVELLRNWELI